ncbi:MAG: D-2-hydroxyacid dehydrogenase [Cyclobacteriaceae bacterium]|nr:D-2-hydroxyacid dehydrogenase [Cyclobacteriaceae bacterium]
MKSTEKSNSRRRFLKGAFIQGAALSSIPLATYGKVGNDIARNGREDKIPRLPLKIMLRSGLSDRHMQKLRSISSEITLITSENEEGIGSADVWFGGISEEQFKRAANLRWIQSPSAGVEYYFYPSFVDSQVLLTNAKGCYGPAIGEHTIGLLFSLTRQMAAQARNMQEGKWQRPENMVEMKGMTIGIVGLGGIGSQVARRARAMDMKVIAVDIVPKYKEQVGDICDDVRLVQDSGLEWLLSEADVVVSAAPHTPVSERMLDVEEFGKMKKGAFFINVSRGKLVHTPALLAALKSGHLAGAGLDVTDPEPLPPDHELWKQPNVIITSHIAAQSQYSFGRMQDVFVENVRRFVHGYPLLNQVDKELGF